MVIQGNKKAGNDPGLAHVIGLSLALPLRIVGSGYLSPNDVKLAFRQLHSVLPFI